MASASLLGNITGYTALAVAAVGTLVGAYIWSHRDDKFWRRFSPSFLMLMLAGVVMHSAGTYLLLSVANTPTLCAACSTLSYAGFGVFFVVLNTKVFRVHKIFTNKLLRTWVMQSSKVYMLAGGLSIVYIGVAGASIFLQAPTYANGACSITYFSSTPLGIAHMAIDGLLLLYSLYLAFKTQSTVPIAYAEARSTGGPVLTWLFTRGVQFMAVSLFTGPQVFLLNLALETTAMATSLLLLYGGKMRVVWFPLEVDKEVTPSSLSIATAWSLKSDTSEAIQEAVNRLKIRLRGEPHYVRVDSHENYDPKTLLTALREFAPNAAIHGATSTFGVMTEEGVHAGGLSLFGLRDPEDSGYGVAGCELGDNPRVAGRNAIKAAIDNCGKAGRNGASPDVVLMSASPGEEEDILAGITDVCGAGVKVTGGSSGDDNVAGKWAQYYWDPMTNAPVIMQKGVVLSSMYTSVYVNASFYTGYAPSPYSGVLTKVGPRKIYEIDGKPAATVYNKWSGGKFADLVGGAGGNCVKDGSLFPLGRLIGQDLDYEDQYQLVLPTNINTDDTMDTLAAVHEGERLTLMPGNLGNLTGTVTRRAVQGSGFRPSEIRGAFVVYCAGCMLAVQPELKNVVKNMRLALGQAPFAAAFTLGEQGTFPTGEVLHGNNMFAVLTFSSVRKGGDLHLVGSRDPGSMSVGSRASNPSIRSTGSGRS